MSYFEDIFCFRGIQVLKPDGSSPITGVLKLRHEQTPDDRFLSLKFESELGTPELETRLDGERPANKLDPQTFCITLPDGGDLLIFFPPVDDLVPIEYLEHSATEQDAKGTVTWQQVIDSFDIELTRWISCKHPGGQKLLLVGDDGTEVGQLSGYEVVPYGINPGSKDPVVVSFPDNGEGAVEVRPATADYLRDASHPVYADSTIVSTAATASRLIVTMSSHVANALQSGADNFTKRTKPNVVPVTFQPSTHSRVRQLHKFSTTAAEFSASTIGQVSKHAQNIGARVAGRTKERSEKGVPEKPGLLNKSLIAFSTIADGIDYATKAVLASGSNAATTVVGHKYGEEARSIAHGLTGSVKNVGLVYVDASGVSRRAIVKGVAKGMVVGKVRGGGDVIVPGQGEPIDGIPQGWNDGHLGGAYAGPPSQTPLYNPPQNQLYGAPGTPPPPGYGPANSTGNGGPSNLYFPPPPTSAISPQATGSNYYPNGGPSNAPPYNSSMRDVSPRPMDEKSGNIHGGYRY